MSYCSWPFLSLRLSITVSPAPLLSLFLSPSIEHKEAPRGYLAPASAHFESTICLLCALMPTTYQRCSFRQSSLKFTLRLAASLVHNSHFAARLNKRGISVQITRLNHRSLRNFVWKVNFSVYPGGNTMTVEPFSAGLTSVMQPCLIGTPSREWWLSRLSM